MPKKKKKSFGEIAKLAGGKIASMPGEAYGAFKKYQKAAPQRRKRAMSEIKEKIAMERQRVELHKAKEELRQLKSGGRTAEVGEGMKGMDIMFRGSGMFDMPKKKKRKDEGFF